MLAALVIVGGVCVVLLAIIVRDEVSYHSGHRDGYNAGWEARARMDRERKWRM